MKFYTTTLNCDLNYFTTKVLHERHERDTSDTRATRDTNATRVPHEQHECNTSAIRVKEFDFDNDTSENRFPHP